MSSVPTLDGSPERDRLTPFGVPLTSPKLTVPAGLKALPAVTDEELGETLIEKSKPD